PVFITESPLCNKCFLLYLYQRCGSCPCQSKSPLSRRSGSDSPGSVLLHGFCPGRQSKESLQLPAFLWRRQFLPAPGCPCGCPFPLPLCNHRRLPDGFPGLPFCSSLSVLRLPLSRLLRKLSFQARCRPDRPQLFPLPLLHKRRRSSWKESRK